MAESGTGGAATPEENKPSLWNRLTSLVTGQDGGDSAAKPPPLPSSAKPAAPSRFPPEPFRWDANDPLANEYQLITQFAMQVVATGWHGYPDIDFNATEPGRKLIETDSEAAVRLVMAVVDIRAHYQQQVNKVRKVDISDAERLSWLSGPVWREELDKSSAARQTQERLMRRKLPFSTQHLLKLAERIDLENYNYAVAPVVKAIEAHGEIDASETALRAELAKLAKAMRNHPGKDLPKLAQRLEVALSRGIPAAGTVTAEENETPRTVPEIDFSQPAPVGSTDILVQLKQYLKIMPKDEVTTITMGFDLFPLRADSPLGAEHELINQLLEEVVGQGDYHDPHLPTRKAGQAMLRADDKARSRVILALVERCANVSFVPGGGLEEPRRWQSQSAVWGTFRALSKTHPKFDRNSWFDLLLYLSALGGYRGTANAPQIETLLKQTGLWAAQSPFTPGERHVLHRIRVQSVRACPFGHATPEVARLNHLIGDELFMALVPGEAWTDRVNRDLGRLPRTARESWLNLLRFVGTANSARPSARWLKIAKETVENVGVAAFYDAVTRWFALVNEPRTIRLLPGAYMARDTNDNSMHEENMTCLRGLLWMLPKTATPELIRSVGALTVSCYKKLPGVGARAVKAANAGVYALSQMEDRLALGQLALLKVKVKFGSAQKEIEKAFNAAAERSGLPREELEEMSVPTYGLTEVGVCEEPMGEYTARLTVTGTTSTELVWVKSDGKTQKSIPSAVKETHAEELKELQAAAKDIQKMLPAQRERIDSLFLQQKTWQLALWRERYLNHPLVGTLARRILWDFKNGDKEITAIWFKGQLVDLDLRPVELAEEGTTVQLWHPIGKSTEEIVAWRSWLDAQGIQQPFKQAHREIYVLTDAERNTRVYSNRYAAHVLKQHQFNALCGLRGWKNQLRLMVDAEYSPPTLRLPQWGLRAEFWVEGIGTDYGADTNESGVYLYLSTDQVRFYRLDDTQRTAHAGGGGYQPNQRITGPEPVPMEEIPPLVFSEVMRDADLFVGVASVGNDPAWSDGGPNGRYQNYWQNVSFGDLSASAKTRKDVLQRLIPKLKIAKVCSFNEKYLVVKGSLRTYKIHLGSGNILMEPNDQYLCIVPRQGEAEKEPVLLPFEGDRTLSVILSKAFLLADDTKIKDPTITGQILRK